MQRDRRLGPLAEADPGSVKRGGGGRESKFLDAAPENKKNRPKKQKSAEKKGGGGPRPIRPPPPLDPPLLWLGLTNFEVASSMLEILVLTQNKELLNS